MTKLSMSEEEMLKRKYTRPYEKRIAELEEKISILLSCKNCPENKGGLICAKEYENKCLAQKMQYIKELQEENAELKSLKDVADLIRLNNSHIVAMVQLNNNNVALRKENTELKARVSEQSERISELTQELDDKINRFG